MRISTSQIFESGTSQLGTLQSQMAKTQMQLSTNRRMLSAADDPVASARALEVTQSQSVNTQFANNRANARSSLSLEEVALSSAGDLIKDVQELVVRAGNGAMNDSDRMTFATELEGRLQDLLAVANTADGQGGYVFGGFKSTDVPFMRTATGATYNGDQGQKQLQVASSRQVALGDSGSDVFENNLTGNGTFTTRVADTNTGAATVSAGAVTDKSLLTNHNYQINFVTASTPSGIGYTVTDLTLGTTVLPVAPAVTPLAYESGKAITFDGMALEVKGAVNSGDVVGVEPSKKQSLFTTLTDLLQTLKTPAGGAAANAKLTNGLTEAHENLDKAFDNVLGVRASLGARMKELDYLDTAGDDLDIQYTATLSGLQDLDLVKAISLFSQQEMSLQAAQKSFKTMSSLSLFNYI
jgi:flagellar hook-associated protein 3 FlgL